MLGWVLMPVLWCHWPLIFARTCLDEMDWDGLWLEVFSLDL